MSTSFFYYLFILVVLENEPTLLASFWGLCMIVEKGYKCKLSYKYLNPHILTAYTPNFARMMILLIIRTEEGRKL